MTCRPISRLAGTLFDINRKMRVVLETYCRTTYQASFQAGDWLGDIVRKIFSAAGRVDRRAGRQRSSGQPTCLGLPDNRSSIARSADKLRIQPWSSPAFSGHRVGSGGVAILVDQHRRQLLACQKHAGLDRIERHAGQRGGFL